MLEDWSTGNSIIKKPNPDKPELKKSFRKNVIVKFACFSQRLFSSPQRRRVRREKQFIFTGR